MRRVLLPAGLALVLLAGGCAYESSGTTTSTVVDPAAVPPATGPAALSFEDQMVEGSAVVVASVTLPAGGFVILQADAAGAPGEVLGVSQLIGRGTVSGVVVPFLFPLEGAAVIHATLHVDMDQDGQFRYEPPDDFIDLPATLGDGAVATATASIGLLAPIAPATVALAEQRIDGVWTLVAEATLPAAGFVGLHSSADGVPGMLLGLSALLPAGTTRDLAIALSPPLTVSQPVIAVVYIDRDGDGAADLTSAESLDAVAEGLDGRPARALAEITVVLLSPAALEVEDQEGDGTRMVVASVTLPSEGFLELLADQGGAPGALLKVSELLPRGASADVELTLDEALAEDATLWVRVRIDFDGDGALGADDPVALTAAGAEAQAVFDFTYVEGD